MSKKEEVGFKTPSAARYQRIQAILGNQPAFKDKLGPCDYEIAKRTGGTLTFHRGVVAVTDELHRQGYDAHNAPPPLVINVADGVLNKIRYSAKKPEPREIRPAKPQPKPKAAKVAKPKKPKVEKPKVAKPEKPKPEKPKVAKPKKPKVEKPKVEKPKPEPKAAKPKAAKPKVAKPKVPKTEKPKAETPPPPKPEPALPPVQTAEKPEKPKKKKTLKKQDSEAKQAVAAATQASNAAHEPKPPHYYPYTVALSLMLTVANMLELADTEAGNEGRKKRVGEIIKDLYKLKDRPVLLPPNMKPYLADAENRKKA